MERCLDAVFKGSTDGLPTDPGLLKTGLSRCWAEVFFLI